MTTFALDQLELCDNKCSFHQTDQLDAKIETRAPQIARAFQKTCLCDFRFFSGESMFRILYRSIKYTKIPEFSARSVSQDVLQDSCSRTPSRCMFMDPCFLLMHIAKGSSYMKKSVWNLINNGVHLCAILCSEDWGSFYLERRNTVAARSTKRNAEAQPQWTRKCLRYRNLMQKWCGPFVQAFTGFALIIPVCTFTRS